MKYPTKDDWENEREYLSVLELAKELDVITASIDEQIDRVGVEYFNVRDYPAATPQASIQAAIDAANAAGGGVAFVPRGSYGVTGSILMKSNVTLLGEGYGSRIYVASAFADNVLKFEGISNASAMMVRIDGNRASVSGNQYGFFMGGADDCKLLKVYAHACRGDGIHFYDCDGCQISACHSWDNLFHGLEIEQCRDFQNIGGTYRDNDVNGIYIFEGEVSATGSHGVTVVGANCYANDDYGIAVQGPLSDDIIVASCTFRSNGNYGATLFDRVKGVTFANNVVALNGDHGLYMFRIEGATIIGNRFRNNSQNSNGGFQEILLDGDGTQYSINNTLTGNTILINGTNKAAYGIKENSTNDTPNPIRANTVLGSPTVAPIGVVNDASMRLCRGNIGRVTENGGVSTQNGDGATTVFNIPHGLTTDAPRISLAVPGNAVSSAAHFVSRDATNVIITFAVAPVLGTGNVVFHWYAAH
jgi:hypothetical protein